MIYVRPFLVTLLCILPTLGQLPALIHIGACAHHYDHSGSPKLHFVCHRAKAPTCVHVHCPLKRQASKSTVTVDRHSADTAPAERAPAEHDSGHCTVCQSLLSASLFVQLEVEATSLHWCGKCVSPSESLIPAPSSISIASPRGPPSLE